MGNIKRSKHSQGEAVIGKSSSTIHRYRCPLCKQLKYKLEDFNNHSLKQTKQINMGYKSIFHTDVEPSQEYKQKLKKHCEEILRELQ